MAGSDGRTKVVILLLTASVAVEAIALAFDLMQYDLLSRIGGAGAWTQAEAEANDRRVAIIGLCQGAAGILTGIAFLLWLHRRYARLRSAGFTLRWSPGWAVGCWFVPILNAFRPYQVMTDLWRASGSGATPDHWRDQPGTPLLGWWWAMFLIGGFVGQVASRLASGSGSDLGEMQLMTATFAISDVIWGVGGVLAIVLVRQIRDRMDRNLAHAAG